MKKITAIQISIVLTTIIFLSSGCVSKTNTEEKPTVAVSILPQEYFVTRIAGDLLSINVMIPPGASPATYEPTPSQLASLAKTELYLEMGYNGFEMAWMDKLRAANKQMTVVNLSEGVDLITEATMHGEETDHDTMQHQAMQGHSETDGHSGMHGEYDTGEQATMEGHTDMDEHAETEGHQELEGLPEMQEQSAMKSHGHHHGGIDPHTWLSPKNVMVIARNISDALAGAYPEHKEVFTANLEGFLEELDSLDRRITIELKDLTSRAFFTYHPSLSYFARDYNLEQYPLELGGKTPSAAHMKKLIDTGREQQIGVVFLQMQFDQKNAEVLAREIGAEIVQINPLDPEWYEQMLYISDKLKENLE